MSCTHMGEWKHKNPPRFRWFVWFVFSVIEGLDNWRFGTCYLRYSHPMSPKLHRTNLHAGSLHEPECTPYNTNLVVQIANTCGTVIERRYQLTSWLAIDWSFKETNMDYIHEKIKVCHLIAALQHHGVVMTWGNRNLGHNWFRLWLVSWRHQVINYLHLCWLITNTFSAWQLHGSNFPGYIFKITAASSTDQWVNTEDMSLIIYTWLCCVMFCRDLIKVQSSVVITRSKIIRYFFSYWGINQNHNFYSQKTPDTSP